jgi:hypothetical protein
MRVRWKDVAVAGSGGVGPYLEPRGTPPLVPAIALDYPSSEG